MAHVAREMERQGFELPLLIGGATTSRAHTAVKIAPAYRGPVVHVLDASRAVGVVSQLKGGEPRRPSPPRTAREQERLRREHEARRPQTKLLGLAEARRRRTPIDWARLRAAAAVLRRACACSTTCRCARSRASSTGRRSSTPGSCAAPTRGSSRTPTGARRPASCSTTRSALLDADCSARGCCARARRYGFFPANAAGDDVEVYADESRAGLLGDAAHAAPAVRQGRGRARPGARRLRGAARERPARLHRRLRGHGRHRRGRARRALTSARTTTTPRSW